VADLSSEQRDLLSQLQEDGWPLLILAPRDPGDLERLQGSCVDLVRLGLASVYRSEDFEFLASDEAEAVVSNADNWRRPGSPWYIATTDPGHEVLGLPSEP
jgi:hypothetical protein